MVYIFKTSVKTKKALKELAPKFDKFIPNSKWNFDLDDCDKILRVDSKEATSQQIIEFLKLQQVDCSELDRFNNEGSW